MHWQYYKICHTKKEVVGLWREAPVFKEPQEVIILSVNVTADLNWGFELQKSALAHEDLSRLEDQALDLRFIELDLFARFVAPDFEQFADDLVNVNFGAACHFVKVDLRNIRMAKMVKQHDTLWSRHKQAQCAA